MNGLSVRLALHGKIHIHGHGEVRVHALRGTERGQSPIRFDLVCDGLGGLSINGAILDQAIQQIGTAILQFTGQSLIGECGQIIPQEYTAHKGGVKETMGHGKCGSVRILEVGAILVAQGAQQEHHVVLRAARAGTKGGGGGTVGNAIGIQPCNIGSRCLTYIGEGMGNFTSLVRRRGLLLSTIETDQHDSGLAASRGPVQLKTTRGAAEHPDVSQFLCHGVIVGGGSADTQGC